MLYIQFNGAGSNFSNKVNSIRLFFQHTIKLRSDREFVFFSAVNPQFRHIQIVVRNIGIVKMAMNINIGDQASVHSTSTRFEHLERAQMPVLM